MTIIISPDELEPNFQLPWKLGLVHHPSIDYADNAIWATFEGKQITLFKFSWWGLVLDNRWCGYNISAGAAGILIDFQKKD